MLIVHQHTLQMFEDTELLPKGDFTNAAGEFCLFDVVNFCGNFLDLLFGPSDHQRNDVRLPTFDYLFN